MSSDGKRPCAQAYRAAQRFEELLFHGDPANGIDPCGTAAPMTTRWCWCGSLRRGRELVGDLELVAIDNGGRLLARLDELVAAGAIAR